jgi:hypothetical protein
MVVAVIFILKHLLIKKRKFAKSKSMIMKTNQIQRDKIIIAIEIDKLFVNYSSNYKSNYEPIFGQPIDSYLVRIVKNFLGLGDYYKPIFNNR